MENSVKKPTATKIVKPRHRAIDLVWERAYQEAADFIGDHTATAMIFDQRFDLYKFAFRNLLSEGLLLEFGVSKGSSINRFADILKKKEDTRVITGFDAFSGLSEDWVGHAYPKLERFDLKGKAPDVRDNVRLVNGWIDDTLPPFLSENGDPIAFIHVDTDTYAPAKTILDASKERLREGSIVIFDELIGYPGWRHGEHKALLETLPQDSYKYLAFSGFQAMIVMTRALTF